MKAVRYTGLYRRRIVFYFKSYCSSRQDFIHWNFLRIHNTVLSIPIAVMYDYYCYYYYTITFRCSRVYDVLFFCWSIYRLCGTMVVSVHSYIFACYEMRTNVCANNIRFPGITAAIAEQQYSFQYFFFYIFLFI